MAWYEFISDGVKKSKRERANPDPMPPEQFGYQIPGGRDIPHTFDKNIGLEDLAINPKGTPATLTLDVTGDPQRFRTVECRLLHLKTKAKEVVDFPFGLQQAGVSTPLKTGSIHGRVRLVTLARFDRNQFPRGPRGPMAHLLGIPG